MNNQDKYAQWLQNEQKNALAYYQEAMKHATLAEANYWAGYGDSALNAEAAYWGPTPLEQDTTEETARINYLEKQFADYLSKLKRGDFNDARLVARGLEYETYQWDPIWLAADKERNGKK